MAEADEQLKVPTGLWRTSAAVILVTGTLLRICCLDLVPLHHDEGVNGNFVIELLHHGFYQYNPENYHGPTLYYLSAVIPWTSRLLLRNPVGEAYGLTAFTIRFVTAAFGIGTIWLLLSLRRYLGTVAALAAAALLAVSPGAVYLSRYFIHETLLVFFTVGALVAALKFYEAARPGYLLLAAALAALLFATKETAIISVAVLLVALISTLLYVRFRKPLAGMKGDQQASNVSLKIAWRSGVERFGGPTSVAFLSVAALSFFATIYILFYSSFFTNYPKGLYDSLKTFQVWTGTGTQAHVRPWSTYLMWMLRKESVLLLLGTGGAAVAIWRGRNTFAIFTALWALGILVAYSLIPYKTPWLMLNFLVPLAITGGSAIEAIYKGTKKATRVITTATVVIAALGVSSYQMITLNFFRYDDPSQIYPYHHTYREFLPLVDEIERAAKLAGTGYETGVTVTSPDFWPLPWYLRNYPRRKFYEGIVSSADPIIVGSAAQMLELESSLGSRYVMVKSGQGPSGAFPLRPGIDLVLFVRGDLAPR